MRVKKPSSLITWVKRLYERKGFKKAAVATSRKLAVIMRSIWRDGTVFETKVEAIT